MSKIKVSVTLIAYKHAKYMRQCLDSILEQECNFKYEIIVSDDCSGDGSAEILKEYQTRYPDIVKPIIHDSNQGVIKNVCSLLPHVTGQYVAGGECDDYWTDKYRLQKQVDYLDAHPDCAAVGSNFYNVSSDGKKSYISMLKWQVNRKYELSDYLKNGMEIHGNTIMTRVHHPYKDKDYQILLDSIETMFDIVSRVLMYDKGYIYVMPDIMHAHRMGSVDKTSFFYSQKTKAIQLSYTYYNIVKALNVYFKGKYDFTPLISNRTAGVLLGWMYGNYKLNWSEFNAYFKTLPVRARILTLHRLFRKIKMAVSHRIGRKLRLFYKITENEK